MAAITTPFTTTGQLSLTKGSPYERSMVVEIYGTQTGLTFAFEASIDGTNGWTAIEVEDLVTGQEISGKSQAISPTDLASYKWRVPCDGVQIRMNVSAISGGSCNVNYRPMDWAPFALTLTNTISASSLASTITASSVNALAVGPNGTTNPTLQVDTSTASAATGLLIKGAAAGGGVALTAISSGNGEAVTLQGSAGSGATAGGSASLLGGTAGATSAGGAALVTGANGGATSGTGGAATIAGGAGAAGNSAGGVASLTGGAGQGSAAGGIGRTVGGAGGATGAGGAAQLTGGAGGATSGTGGAATIAGGAGTAGNAVGGAATLTGGAGQGTAVGGVATVTGGASGSGASGNGAAASVIGGAALSTAGNGGAANLTGGVATTTGTGGAVNITSGASAGASGTSGAVLIDVGSAAGGTAGIIGIGETNAKFIYLGRGGLNYPIFGVTETSIGTAQSSTPTAAQLFGGVITQTSSVGAGTVTVPTGTTLSSAFPRTPAVGDSFTCTFANLGGGQTLTLTGQTGTNMKGTVAVGSGKNATMEFVNTGANTWDIFCIVSA